MSKLFLITGVSTGLGRALAEEALKNGHTVAGTVRHADQRAAFERLAPGRAHARLLDVSDIAAIPPLVDGIEREIGAIDVLVNNAGYGHEGTIEESPLEDLRRQFEVNFFGAVAMLKAVLPHMRKRRHGRILNVTSQGGITTIPGTGFYHASKFALEGLSETLAKEVRGFGIYVTAVEPGAFRTDWTGRSLVRAGRTVADYDTVFDPVRARRLALHGNQHGDPAKAARAMLALVESPDPPMHLPIGPDAVRNIREKLELLKSEIDAWEPVSTSTDFS